MFRHGSAVAHVASVISDGDRLLESERRIPLVARRLRSLRRNLDRDGLKVRALAVFGTYDPRAAAGFLTIGLGVAGGLGGGGRTAGKAVSDVADWGERERKSVVPLPQRVVAVVTDGTVVLYGWQRFGG
jgi:hypothetical protein